MPSHQCERLYKSEESNENVTIEIKRHGKDREMLIAKLNIEGKGKTLKAQGPYDVPQIL